MIHTTLIYSNYYIEIDYNNAQEPENSNIKIAIFNTRTNGIYSGIFNSGEISMQSMKIENIYNMLTNALNSVPAYTIDFNFMLEYSTIFLKYQNEIITILQNIRINSNNNDTVIKSRYSIFLLQKENKELKDSIELIKQSTASKEEVFNKITENYYSLSKQVEQLQRDIERLSCNNQKNSYNNYNSNNYNCSPSSYSNSNSNANTNSNSNANSNSNSSYTMEGGQNPVLVSPYVGWGRKSKKVIVNNINNTNI